MRFEPGQNLTLLCLCDDGADIAMPARFVDRAPGELRIELQLVGRKALDPAGLRFICDENDRCQGLLMVDPARALELGL